MIFFSNILRHTPKLLCNLLQFLLQFVLYLSVMKLHCQPYLHVKRTLLLFQTSKLGLSDS